VIILRAIGLRAGMPLAAAARRVGVGESTVHRWIAAARSGDPRSASLAQHANLLRLAEPGSEPREDAGSKMEGSGRRRGVKFRDDPCLKYRQRTGSRDPETRPRAGRFAGRVQLERTRNSAAPDGAGS
jgi:hypothetical protein